MTKRRQMLGRPLLVASVGIAMSVVSGCGGKSMVAGNLMPPPERPERYTGELCVTTIPAEAHVLVDWMAASEQCTTVTSDSDSVQLEVTMPGHLTHLERIQLGTRVELTVTLTPTMALPDPMPVGNLMAPQPPIEPTEPAPPPNPSPPSE